MILESSLLGSNLRARTSSGYRVAHQWLPRSLPPTVVSMNTMPRGRERGETKGNIRRAVRFRIHASKIMHQPTRGRTPARHEASCPSHSMVNFSGVSVASFVKLTGSPVAAADTALTAILAKV